MSEFLYRYETVRYGYADDGLDISFVTVEVVPYRFQILSKTKKGCWVLVHGERKLVYPNARNAYARYTLEEALESLRCRKSRRVLIVSHSLAMAKKELAAANAASVDTANFNNRISNL